MNTKKLAVAAIAAVIAAVLAIPAFAATKTVAVKDNFFSPKSLTVGKGTTVKWVWRGSRPHNVKVTKGPVKFTSPTKFSGSYSKTMTRRGTYTLVCTIHSGMKMTLRVS